MDSEGYIARIRRQIRTSADVARMYRGIKERRTLTSWPMGKAFEHLVLRAFELEGAEVTWPFQVWFEGQQVEEIDGVVRDAGLVCLLEMKDHDKRIDFTPISKLRSVLARRPSQSIGSIFSIEGFTRPATVLAQFSTPINVLLWNADDIEYGLTRGAMRMSLQMKFRYAVEHGTPDYSIQMEATS